jgi:hypothetical protein
MDHNLSSLSPDFIREDDWNFMRTYPIGEEVKVLLADQTIHERAHWASNLSGEEQPPFEGWFVPCGEHSYREIGTPIRWMPIKKEDNKGKESEKI